MTIYFDKFDKKVSKTSLEIKELNDIATVLGDRYIPNFQEMILIFCYKIDKKKYFIFEEMRSFPLTKIISNKANNSLLFVADWSFFARTFHEKAKVLENKIKKGSVYLEWDEIPNIYESFFLSSTTPQGVFNKWYVHKKYNSQTKISFRFENIKRINSYNWGFEIYTDIINLIAVNEKQMFPYDIEIGSNPVEFSWSGNHFSINKNVDYQGIFSYWIAPGEEIEENEDENFDEMINNLLSGVKKRKIQNVGQKIDTDIILDEDD